MELIDKERDGPIEYIISRTSNGKYSFSVSRDRKVVATDLGFDTAAEAMSAAKDIIHENNPNTLQIRANISVGSIIRYLLLAKQGTPPRDESEDPLVKQHGDLRLRILADSMRRARAIRPRPLSKNLPPDED